jgi:lambda family phage portal protein
MRWKFWERKREVEPERADARVVHGASGGKRSFAAATHRSTEDMGSVLLPNSNDAIRNSLSILRNRSRYLFLSDGYAKKYVSILQVNLIGEQGLRPKCEFRKKGNSQELDSEINAAIERQFAIWGKLGNCDVTRRLTWHTLLSLSVAHIARDGEAIIRLVVDPKAKHGLRLEVIDPVLLDEKLNRMKEHGRNQIIMGVEVDEWGAAVAYYFKKPRDSHYSPQEYTRVQAEEIVHVFRVYFAGQVRGFPWLHASIVRMHNTTKYEEAEVVAARIQASKMGFIVPSLEDESMNEDRDDSGNVSMDVEPGTIGVLPPGASFEAWDPQHPHGNTSEFVKSMLLGTASGLDVSYAALSSDLSKVNFSSVRHGEAKDRDKFKFDQKWLIENLCEPIYAKWVECANLKGAIRIRPVDIEDYKYTSWIAKRWAWVDPLKDTNASIAAIEAGLKSRQEVCAEMGRDYEDVMRELAEEEKLAKELGVPLRKAASGTMDIPIDKEEEDAAG